MRLDYARDTSHAVAMAHFIFLFRTQRPGQSVIRRRRTAVDQGDQCAGRLGRWRIRRSIKEEDSISLAEATALSSRLVKRAVISW